MHGVFHKGLKDFVVDEYGDEVWAEARASSGVDRQVYLAINYYPDEEFISLVETVGALVDDSPFDLLEGFGAFVADRLLDTYGRVVDDEWTAMDLLERVESEVHTSLREHNEDLSPPELSVSRRGADEAIIVYQSPRRLCPIAIGLIVGVGDHLDEPLSVTERRCMHDGDGQCELLVERS